MSTENQDSKQLTIDDPIPEATMKRLQELRAIRTSLCEQNMDLDMEKIRLQVAIRQIDTEKDRIFESELTARGLTPTTTVEIDAETRKLHLVKG